MDEDEFLEKFKRSPSDPKPTWALSSENLLEEMEQVPLFMTKIPDKIEDNPLLEALQSLVYDGPPSEIAANFKNQGNEAFKEGKWNDAQTYYTKGLEQSEHGDIGNELKGTLLLNRAAVHLEKSNLFRNDRKLWVCFKGLPRSFGFKSMFDQGLLSRGQSLFCSR